MKDTKPNITWSENRPAPSGITCTYIPIKDNRNKQNTESRLSSAAEISANLNDLAANKSHVQFRF